ncbi:MAG: Flp pilus assembly complex ATPase component TadA, partial [Methanomicrobiales archaeon]|nr:Flp pilus assembly complex ATPase component TadA [Methanomicrobiales archaeon]
MPQDDESKNELDALLKRIGTYKKGEEPAHLPEETGHPQNPLPEQEGDLSSLMKRIGNFKEEEGAGTPPAGKPPGKAAETKVADPAPEPQPVPSPIPEDVPPAPPRMPEPAPLPEPIPAGEDVPVATGEPAGEAASFTPAAARKTQWSSGAASAEAEKIVSIDQIKDISELILPKGATFDIDEVKLQGRTNVFDVTSAGTLPTEIDEIWKTGLPSVGLKDIGIGAESVEEPKSKGILGRVGKIGLFKAIRPESVEYNRKIHGPLVDLTLKPEPGVEEIELYPVNEPYAYIRVTYDNATHEYTYKVLEPELTEAERDLLSELKERLFETLDINTKDITRQAARSALRGAVDEIIADYGISLTPVSREKILYNIEKDFLGDGLVDAIMHDKYIEDISCDGVNSQIFTYHTSYENIKTNLVYRNANELDSFVTKLAQRAGKYISIAEPMLDATMSDGSRIQMTLGQEVTAHGSTFTIRKFREEPITPTDLIEWSTFSPLSIAYLWLAVENGKSAIFAGGTASGKTTSLNAISLFIPPAAKVITLEDTRELKLPHPNWIPSITRSSFDSAGKGEIDMYELLRAALRQRPEYLLVGEVRGREALTLFQAMSTGHVTYSTMHADSVASVVHRLENPPLDVPRNMLSALKLVSVQVQARVGGQRIRRNKQIIEILDIDPRTNELITNEVFRWNPASDEIRYSGKSFILEEIMEDRGWSEARMREELKRRQELLEWMRLKMIRHYTDVAKMLISYHRDPEAVIKLV